MADLCDGTVVVRLGDASSSQGEQELLQATAVKGNNVGTTNQYTAGDFEGIDPQKMLTVLLRVKDGFKSDKKDKSGNFPQVALPSSYSKISWEKMTNHQAKVVVEFFKLGCKNGKQAVLLQQAGLVNEPVAATTEHFSKNDMIRLLMTRVDPACQRAWVAAEGVINHRPELDAMRSHESDDRDDALKGWSQLADVFNNRSSTNAFQPVNLVVRYNDKNETTKTPANETISQGVADLLWDLNPNEPDRPVRSPETLKARYRDARKIITLIFTNWKRSGSQNGTLSTLV